MSKQTVSEFVNEMAKAVSVEKAINSLAGKTIVPPAGEAALYSPNKLVITECSRPNGNRGWLIKISEPLKKTLMSPVGPQTTVVLKTGFSISPDPDSIWCKFLIEESAPTHAGTLAPEEISAINGIRGRTACISCKLPLVPLYGALLWCPPLRRKEIDSE